MKKKSIAKKKDAKAVAAVETVKEPIIETIVPVMETPVETAPVVEEPVVEAPVAEETPKAEKKTAAKKTTTRKTTTKKAAAPKVALTVEYAGKQVSEETIVEAVKADFQGEIKTMELYVKPEDGAVYYVINGDQTGKVAF